MDLVLVATAAAALLLLLTVLLLLRRVSFLERAIDATEFSKNSQSVKYGKMTEHFIPFTKDFPFNPENFRFIGNPVDGVVFEDDRIIIAEFKAGSAQLSQRQRHIKELVQHKKIEWFEQHVK